MRVTTDEADEAISSFVIAKAEERKREPADFIWLGDVIAGFLLSEQAAGVTRFVEDRIEGHDERAEK